MLEIAAAGFDRRDVLDAFGRAEGQQRRGAIDAGMREPRFGGADQAAGILDAALLRQAADDVIAVGDPKARRSCRRGSRTAPGR